jgi:uncharacterized protein (TIGR02145 family)
MKRLILFMCLAVSISSLKPQNPQGGTVTDIDGNVYHTVVIGNYIWFKENLKTTSYNDGTKIPNLTGSTDWLGSTEGAYCWYDNNESNSKTYGALYNWYAVNTGRICPEGWRVPKDQEWKYLEGYSDTPHRIGDTI